SARRLADWAPLAEPPRVGGGAPHGNFPPKRAVFEVSAAGLLLPVPVGLDLIHEHGAVLPAVPGQIALPVAIDVQPPHHSRALDGPLPYRGGDRPARPGNRLRAEWFR